MAPAHRRFIPIGYRRLDPMREDLKQGNQLMITRSFGKMTRAVVPTPSSLSISRVQPWASTSPHVSGNPNPVPSVCIAELEKTWLNLAIAVSKSAPSIPVPLSMTFKTKLPSSFVPPSILTVPNSCEYLTVLESKLTIICFNRRSSVRSCRPSSSMSFTGRCYLDLRASAPKEWLRPSLFLYRRWIHVVPACQLQLPKRQEYH